MNDTNQSRSSTSSSTTTTTSGSPEPVRAVKRKRSSSSSSSSSSSHDDESSLREKSTSESDRSGGSSDSSNGCLPLMQNETIISRLQQRNQLLAFNPLSSSAYHPTSSSIDRAGTNSATHGTNREYAVARSAASPDSFQVNGPDHDSPLSQSRNGTDPNPPYPVEVSVPRCIPSAEDDDSDSDHIAPSSERLNYPPLPSFLCPSESDTSSDDSSSQSEESTQKIPPQVPFNESQKLPPPVPNEVDYSLLHKQESMAQKKRHMSSTRLSTLQTSSLMLLEILQRMRIQLYAFDTILQWAHRCATEVGHDFSEKPSTRERILNEISQLRGLQQLRPETVDFVLPNTKVETKVTSVSIRECIFSLLNDETLMKEENLLFCGKSPFDPPSDSCLNDPDHLFDDINSGTVYHHSWHKFCSKDPLRKVLLPLIFFIDKTFLDKKGKLNAEPITFTLGIFKRWVRNNNPNAWRSIGHISDAFVAAYKSALNKAKDYHEMITLLFSELKQMQESDGFAWNLKYNGTHQVIFVPVIHMIITDTKCADDLAGRIQFRGTSKENMPARLCRFCDIPGKQINNHEHRYRLTKSTQIKRLYDQNKVREIEDISYRPLRNAFWNLKLSDPYGINGCMPPDTLHIVLKGTHEYTRECFYDLFRLEGTERRVQEELQRQRERAVAEEGIEVNAAVVPEYTEEQLGKYKIFTDTTKPIFESIAKAIAMQLKRQSDRNLPRTHFSQGITKNFAKLSGTEETGVLLLINLSLCSTAGCVMFTTEKKPTYMSTDRYSQWIGTIERLLLMEQWLKDVDNDVGHTRRDLEIIEEYIPPLLHRLGNTLERRKGLGTNIVKFHLLRHVTEAHVKYGRLENSNTAQGETRHKHFVKDEGEKTQKKKETFDREVCQRNIETVIINSGITNMDIPDTKSKSSRRVGLEGYLYHVDRETIAKHRRSTCFVPLGDEKLPKKVKASLNLIHDSISESRTSKQFFTIFHTFSDSVNTYRACPSFHGSPWYDWANLTASDDDHPQRTVRVLLFFRSSNTPPGFKLLDQPIVNDVSYLIYEKLSDKREPIHKESVILSNTTLDKGLHCAQVSAILSPAIVYQDVAFRGVQKITGIRFTEFYTVMTPRSEWASLFLHRAKTDEITERNKTSLRTQK